MRHGTRNPNKKLIKRYNNLTEIRDWLSYNGKLPDRLVESFKVWKPTKIDLSEEKFLTKEGEREMMGLSQRLFKRFPGLFRIDNSTDYLVSISYFL